MRFLGPSAVSPSPSPPFLALLIAWSNLLAMFTAFSPCSGRLQMSLAAFSLISTTEPTPHPQLRAGCSSLYTLVRTEGWSSWYSTCLVGPNPESDVQKLKKQNKTKTSNKKIISGQEGVFRLGGQKVTEHSCVSTRAAWGNPYLVIVTEENESQDCGLQQEVPEINPHIRSHFTKQPSSRPGGPILELHPLHSSPVCPWETLSTLSLGPGSALPSPASLLLVCSVTASAP